jgi:hypothetical protein
MKRITFIIISLFLLASSQAQDIKFGAKAGFITSCIADEDVWFKPAAGFNLGLFGSYEVMKPLSVSIEPAFANLGARDINILDLYSSTSFKLWDYTKNEPITYDHHDLHLTMLEIPVLAHYSLELGSMKVRAFAGPSLDFILKATLSSYREDIVIGETRLNEIHSNEEITDRFSYYDFSGVIGAGVDLELDPIDLSIDLSYKHGFKNINVVKDKSRLDMRTFNLSVGIGINKLFF